jgi:hypothetical protein
MAVMATSVSMMRASAPSHQVTPSGPATNNDQPISPGVTIPTWTSDGSGVTSSVTAGVGMTGGSSTMGPTVSDPNVRATTTPATATRARPPTPATRLATRRL